MKFIYVLYAIYSTNWKRFIEFVDYFSIKHAKGRIYIFWKVLKSLLLYDTHPMDYFYFRFFEKPEFIQNEYANTLFMNKFHRRLNNTKYRKYFQNKSLFLKSFCKYVKHRFFEINSSNQELFAEWIKNIAPNKIIVKKIYGTGGCGVKKINLHLSNSDFISNKGETLEQLHRRLLKENYLLIEEFIEQHDELMKWNPSCLNTIRIVTITDKIGGVSILGAVIRLGVNGDVDNFHSGGIAVLIDMELGITSGKGFRLYPSELEYFEKHPVSGISFKGLVIPYWNEVISLLKSAVHVIPQVRTVGWDIAITNAGPTLVEGNDNWDKIIMEKAFGKGIKTKLNTFLLTDLS